MIQLYAIGREYAWVPVTSGSDLTTATGELALLADAQAQPEELDWNDAVIEVGSGANSYDVGMLVGTTPGVSITSGTDYQLWVRITAGDEVIIRKSGIVEAL